MYERTRVSVAGELICHFSPPGSLVALDVCSLDALHCHAGAAFAAFGRHLL